MSVLSFSDEQQRRYGTRQAILLTMIMLAGASLYPSVVRANGAAAVPGLLGADIASIDSMPLRDITVAESVVIDLRSETISVAYNIESAATRTGSMTMVFPLEGKDCGNVTNDTEKKIDFRAEMNGVPLETHPAASAGSRLRREFTRRGSSLCRSISFPVEVRPGRNTLVIRYADIPTIKHTMTGSEYVLAYPLWPAGNWVKKFRTAVWRVMLPDRSSPIVPRTLFGAGRGKGLLWATREINVQAAGTRTDGNDWIEFRTSDFAPAGEIAVTVREEWTDPSLLSACDNADGQACLEKFLSVRTYAGDVRCYSIDDLYYLPGSPGKGPVFDAAALPYFRSEIAARKGHRLQAPEMQGMFSRMPWYSGRAESAALNDVEQWNVDFLTAAEETIRSGSKTGDERELLGGMQLPPCPVKNTK